MTGLTLAARVGGISRKLLPKVGVAMIAIGIAFGVCELAARMIFPPPPITREPQVVYRYDPEIRYVLSPAQKGWIDNGLITVNSLGFRGKEVASPKPRGRFRIVVIGDSLTLGWGVDDDQTFSARLEQRLHGKFPRQDLDVINLGVGGYNTRQEITLLTRNVTRLEPDLVLVGFYSNDVGDALAAAGTRIVASNPEAGQIMHMNHSPMGWGGRQLRRSRAIYVIGRAFNRLRNAGEWGTSGFSMEIDLLEGRGSPELDRAWQNVAEQFSRLKSLADAHSFAVGIAVLPCREQVMGQYANATYQNKVRALAEPLGFHVIDPLPWMSAKQTSKQDLFIPYDRNHPSAAGHELIGQAIADDLADHHMVVTAPPR